MNHEHKKQRSAPKMESAKRKCEFKIPSGGTVALTIKYE